MKIDNRYEIRVVILEIREGIGAYRSIGDVYDNFEEFMRDKPDSDYKYGYVVFDTKYGIVPDNCNEWNDSPEEAMFDYENNCFEEEKNSMKYGNVWVSICNDCGENEGGFYCQVYSDENMEDEIDSFCIRPEDCNCNDDTAVEKYIEWYLDIEECREAQKDKIEKENSYE